MVSHELRVFPYPGGFDDVSGRNPGLGDAFTGYPGSSCFWMQGLNIHVQFSANLHFFLQILVS